MKTLENRGRETMRNTPVSIDDAIECYSGFNAQDASDMSEAEIREYFSAKHFRKMFPRDADISGWDWTFEELADRAIEMVHDYNNS